jgi:ATP-dependent Clp protease, protease subunit
MDIKQQDNQDKKTIVGKPLSTIYEFYLVGDIESPDQYTEWFDIIRNIGLHDVVRLYINSVGGDLFTSIQFRNVIRQCQGTIMIEVEGACMSAATMIMLASDNIDISDNSMFMFHNYSGGVIGKGGEMYDNIIHERQWSEQLLRDVYVDFLEEDEIQQILDNRDIWMDSDDVIKRLINRAELKKVTEESS